MIKFKRNDTYNKGTCPIAAIDVVGLSPDKIVNIISYDNQITENSEDYHKIITLPFDPTISGFKLTYYKYDPDYPIDLLVSNGLNANLTPLFYTYELKFDAYGITQGDLVQIYKNNEELIRSTEYNIKVSTDTYASHYINGVLDTNYEQFGSAVTWTNYDINETPSIVRVKLQLPIDFFFENNFYTVRYTQNLFGFNTPAYMELIEIKKLYNIGSDFIISNVGGDTVIQSASNNFNLDGIENLYVIKDPRSRIKPEGIYTLNSQAYQNDIESSWNVRLQAGSIYKFGDIDGKNSKYFRLKPIPGVEGTLKTPIVFIKPESTMGNVLKVTEKPIYINESRYKYPNYNIDLYDKYSPLNITPTGTFALGLDGKPTDEFKILSVDREKGYICFNKSFSAADHILLSYYIEAGTELIVYGLELNPTMSSSGCLYGLGKKANSIKNLGIALRNITPPQSIYNDFTSYYYPYFFDYDNISGGFFLTPPVPSDSPILPVFGKLIFDPYQTNEVDPISGQFLPICLINLNKLTPKNLQIEDVRVIGGGVSDIRIPNISEQFKINYSDIGYYDGQKLHAAGMLIIHIPRAVYDGLVNRWKNSDLFNPSMFTDITPDEYSELQSETAVPDASGLYDYYQNEITSRNYEEHFDFWARREASHYLDQLIKKYISGGTNYILLDEDFKKINLVK